MIKDNLEENSWMFATQTFMNRFGTSENDPIDVSTQVRLIESYEEDLEELSSKHSDKSNAGLRTELRNLLGRWVGSRSVGHSLNVLDTPLQRICGSARS
jgi:hypothetical protein